MDPRRKSWIDFENKGFNEDLNKLTHRLSINSIISDSPAHRRATENTLDGLSSAPDSATSIATQRSTLSLNSNYKDGDLKAWLSSIQLGEYHDTLVANDITFDMLTYLRKEDIKELVSKVGDRIRLWKAICELESNSSSLDESLGSTYGTNRSSSSIASETEPAVTVRFYAIDNKVIHIDIRSTGSILPMVFQTAKLPSNGSYKLHDGFDFYEDDATLREAIFKRNIHEFWIQSESDASLDAASEISNDGTLTIRGNENKPFLTDQAKLSDFSSVDRPTSREVASRISDFFPESKQERLAEGLRNSVLINKRFSTISGGWRSSVRSSRRFSTLTFPDAASTMGEVETGTAVAQSIVQLPIPELTELDSNFLEKLDDEEMSPSEWLRGKLIGSGSFGSVYLAFNVFNGDIMAVKQVQLVQKDQRQKKMIDAMHQEIRTLRVLEHPNIVQYRGFKNEGEYLNIFLDYIAGGSLATKVANSGPLAENTVRKYIGQCLSGLEYLHERGIIHRDIKGANILVDANDEVKISDFGLSKHEETAKQRYSMQGTAFWMAPEVARAREQTTTKADIWSLGCLIIELITGQHPFPKLQAFQAIYKIGKGSTPDTPEMISPQLKDLLLQCLCIEPKERPSAYELLKHPFFKS